MSYMNNLNKDFLGGMSGFDRGPQWNMKLGASPSQSGAIMVQGMPGLCSGLAKWPEQDVQKFCTLPVLRLLAN